MWVKFYWKISVFPAIWSFFARDFRDFWVQKSWFPEKIYWQHWLTPGLRALRAGEFSQPKWRSSSRAIIWLVHARRILSSNSKKANHDVLTVTCWSRGISLQNVNKHSFSKLNAEWRYFKKNFRKKSLSEKRTITGRNEILDIGQSDYTRKVWRVLYTDLSTNLSTMFFSYYLFKNNNNKTMAVQIRPKLFPFSLMERLMDYHYSRCESSLKKTLPLKVKLML